MWARSETAMRPTSTPIAASPSSSSTKPASETTVPPPISSRVPATSAPEGTTRSATLTSPTSIEWPALLPPPKRATMP